MNKTNRDKFKILFVCTGNTCRSPMAEGILKNMLKQNRIDNVQVSSAGTFGLQNAPAALFAIEVAQARKVDLSPHRSRQLTRNMIQQADLILAMSHEHLDFINRMDKQASHKAYLLKAFPQPNLASNEDQNRGVLSIKDPMGGSLDDYEHSFSEIEREVRRIFSDILRLVRKT
jgi:protein-tyrosine-phosphatase